MNNELLHGTLEMLVLKTLTWEPMHGFGIGRWIEQASGDSLTIEEGSLYPALHRIEKRGWIEAEWRQTENNRRGKYYSITTEGRRQLKAQAQSWLTIVRSVGRVLETSKQPS